MSENKNIKIFVSCDKDSYVPNNPYLYPVQVGAALAKTKFSNMFHDDEGDNISDKNRSYCELTAQYWAWKNQDADYYGFFHYRRYMCFDETLEDDDIYGNVLADRITDKTLEKLSIVPEKMEKYITSHDAVVVRLRKLLSVENVYKEYSASILQHKKDIDVVVDIIKRKYPEFVPAMEKYFSGDEAHDCNMFIMNKKMFNEYCTWLFDILFESEKLIDTTNYNVQEYRVYGFLAERLCGLYFTYLKMNDSLSIGEVPKVLFKNTNKLKKINPVFENAVPVVLASDNRFSPYLSIMIESMVKKSSPDRNYDFIVLHSNISQKNQDIIKKHNSRSNISVRFVNASDYFDKDKFFVDKHLSIETYYRLIIPELMPDYHKILYLDCDMVVLEDVAKLYDIDLQGNAIGAVKDIDIAGQVKSNMNGLPEYLEKTLGLEDPFVYFQCGTLIIDLDVLKKLTSSKELLKVATSNHFRCHDQDVLNKVLKGHVFYLEQQWNVLMNWENKYTFTSRLQLMKMAPKELYYEYESARNNPYIVHYAGYQKPWTYVDCDFSEYFWDYAKESPYYPFVLSQIRTNLAVEEYYASLPKPEQPVIVHKGRLRRAYECVADHGISYSIILLCRRAVKRVIGKYKVVNGERIYE